MKFGYAIGVLLTLLSAAPASADVITYTFTGTVSFENDGNGIFAGDLTGATATGFITMDTSLGNIFANPSGPSPSIQLVGGSEFGGTNPITAGKLSVGSFSFSTATNLGYDGAEIQYHPAGTFPFVQPAGLSVAYRTENDLGVFDAGDIFESFSFGGTASDDFTLNQTSITSPTVGFVEEVTTCDTSSSPGGPDCYSYSQLNITVNSLSVTDATTVPEPITISLFGAGLAGAVAMRRRKRERK